jgi:DNA-binding Xre family transcriptional regulator
LRKTKTDSGNKRPAGKLPGDRAGRENAGDVGDVVCRLDAVLQAAQRQYGLGIGDLAAITGIDARVLDALGRDLKQQYDLGVFARLCCVFDVQPGIFLEYLTPARLAAERAAPRSPDQVTLPTLSLRTPLPEDPGSIRCLLKQIIAGRRQDYLARLGKPGKRHLSYPDLESLLGIKFQRLADWANNVPTRYDRLKMAELCHALQLGVDDIWRHEAPGSAARDPRADGETTGAP